MPIKKSRKINGLKKTGYKLSPELKQSQNFDNKIRTVNCAY